MVARLCLEDQVKTTMISKFMKTELLDIRFIIFLVFFVLINDPKVHAVDRDMTSSQTLSAESGLDLVSESVHPRLRSVFRTLNSNKRSRRRNKLRKNDTQHRKFYLSTNFQNRRGGLERLSERKNQKMPKIYMTKLPVEGS